MKKVAFLHYAYPPNLGGVEKLMREHVLILANLGYKITVIAGSGEEVDKKINFIKIPEVQSVLRFNPSLYEKIVEKGIVDDEFYTLVKTLKIKLTDILDQQDVIIIHNIVTLVHNLPFIYFIKDYLKNNPAKKIIIWVHDQTFIYGEKIFSVKPGVNLNTYQKKLLLEPIPNAIYVVISNTFRSKLSKVMDLSKNKTVIIPNGINIKKFLEINDNIWRLVKKENLLKNFPVILSPVNILSRKKLDYAIDVVFFLKKIYSEIKYIITGQVSSHRKNQNYFEIISEKINNLDLKKNVIFLKDYSKQFLEDEEIHDLYQLSDFVFFFSEAENFGLPILESILTKTQIFVSNLNIFKEIGAENLIYVNPEKDHPKKTAKLIINHINNNNLIKLNKKIKQNYNLENIIKEKLIPLL